MLVNSEQTYYAVKMNGKIITLPVGDRLAAEQAKLNLPEDQRMIAEVVTVTADGQELLLG